MRSPKPGKLEKKHPAAARDAMEDIKEITRDPHPINNEIRYVGANRDRALGENDRTGRHFDEQKPAPDEGSETSEEHEAD
jgi:hypothetical protein